MKLNLIVILFVFISTSDLLLSQEISWQSLMDSTNYYQVKQDFQTALQWAEKAELLAKAEFGEKDTNYITSLNSIYLCYYYMGKSEKAIEYCEKVKPIIQELRGEESPEFGEVVGNLGVFYYSIGNYEKAEPLYKEALELMTSFYTKWLNGKDKRTAFNEARNEMRDKYHYPYYWGGFVMVGE